ncbi:hypothetical protein C0993_006142 [Termitomyces sp. T159_Od127]|nr:hypothetical protein C0993_006142 [Termitomyces sp. T159_Od127]
MLDRADKNQEHVDTFVEELRWEETDPSKHDKIRALKLTKDEWTRVHLFTDLLMHADNAQQAFSSDQVSTLHLAIPALEALYRAWSSRINRTKYAPFSLALEAACEKIDVYYDKTTNSPAYIMSMTLNPHKKLSYFAKHWPKELQEDVVKCAEEVASHLHWLFMHSVLIQQSFKNNSSIKDIQNIDMNSEKKLSKGLNVLLWKLSDNENEEEMSQADKNPALNYSEDPNQPWVWYFDEYIYAKEKVPTGWSEVEWWGHDLLFRESGPTLLDEAELERLATDENDDGSAKDEEGWDELLLDDEDGDNFHVDIDLESD